MIRENSEIIPILSTILSHELTPTAQTHWMGITKNYGYAPRTYTQEAETKEVCDSNSNNGEPFLPFKL